MNTKHTLTLVIILSLCLLLVGCNQTTMHSENNTSLSLTDDSSFSPQVLYSDTSVLSSVSSEEESKDVTEPEVFIEKDLYMESDNISYEGITENYIVNTGISKQENLSLPDTKTVSTTPVVSISLSDKFLPRYLEDRLIVSVNPKDAKQGREFVWSSSDSNVVKVDQSGLITGINVGSAVIKVTNELGQSAECTVTVTSIPCYLCGEHTHVSTHCPYDYKDIGYLSIPDVGIYVECILSNSQQTCDMEDTACFYYYGTQAVIADHNYQGFDAIADCKVGTKAYIIQPNGEEMVYVCTRVTQGHNTKFYLTDSNYNYIDFINPGGITCYTCNENYKNITLAFFKPL